MDHEMTIDPAMSMQLRDWLHSTADELPEDPALMAGIKATLRAPRPRPWTSPFRSRTSRAVAATLMAAVAVVTVGLAFRGPGPGVRFPSVGAAPSLAPMPLPSGSLPPGRYVFADDVAPLMERYDVSLDAPAGWSNDNGGWVLTKPHGDPPDGATVEVDVVDQIYVDPCHPEAGKVNVPSDASPESFAAILSSWGSGTGGRTATSPTTTEPTFGTYDGRPGVELTVLTPVDVVEAACTDGHYTLWGDEIGLRYIQGPGESFRIRAIQLGSELLILAAASFPDTPTELLAEQETMLDSVRIVSRPGASSAPASTPPTASLTTLPNISTNEPPGRYRVNPRWHGLGEGSEVSVELMPGWWTWNSTIVDQTRGASLELWGIDRLLVDPCAHDRTLDGPWPSLDGFAESVTAWSVANSPTDPVVSVPRFEDVDGHPGLEVTVSIPSGLDLASCANGEYQLWRWIDQDVRRVEPGDELQVRVIAAEPTSSIVAMPSSDARPGLLFIVATTRPDTTPETRAQLSAMVDSVRIEPAGPAASASPAAP